MLIYISPVFVWIVWCDSCDFFILFLLVHSSGCRFYCWCLYYCCCCCNCFLLVVSWLSELFTKRFNNFIFCIHSVFELNEYAIFLLLVLGATLLEAQNAASTLHYMNTLNAILMLFFSSDEFISFRCAENNENDLIAIKIFCIFLHIEHKMKTFSFKRKKLWHFCHGFQQFYKYRKLKSFFVQFSVEKIFEIFYKIHSFDLTRSPSFQA